MYYIYFLRKDNSKFRVGANILLKSIDDETLKYNDRDDLLFNVEANRVDALPLDLSQKAYILKVENEEDIELGEVLYSDSADITNYELTNEKILKRCNTIESMTSFLKKYLELGLGKGINEKIIDEVKRLLNLLLKKNVSYFPFSYAYFETMLEEIKKDYVAYRFAYIANKSLELEKKKVKCITNRNISGRRNIKIH